MPSITTVASQTIARATVRFCTTKETKANNYVITALAAVAGSRVLYILTNLNEFSSPIDIFVLRRAGLVPNGGFLCGFLGSLFFLRKS